MTVMAAAAVAGTAYSIYSSERAASAQKSAASQAQANAQKQAQAADESINAANRKAPNTSAILSAAQQAGKGGASGTLLTGPSGVDPNALTLGKSTLLGG
jgi:hypothetical protein